MYLADLLCNSRRIHFGRRHIQAVLEFARETQGKEIPSYKELRRFQAALMEHVSNPTQQYQSPNGTVFYVNEIANSLKHVSRANFVDLFHSCSFYRSHCMRRTRQILKCADI